MTLIVSDNSPLNLIVRLGVADILPKMFGQVLIPPQVAAEMNHPKAPGEVRAFISTPPPWLVVRPPTTFLNIPTLDPGETAAISLAVELGAVLLIDERQGRVEAQGLGLNIIGAIGVLERAADLRLISDLSATHEIIRGMRFHVADVVLEESLTRHRARIQPISSSSAEAPQKRKFNREP